MFSLQGKRALITGAATGIGQAIAHRLAQSGAQVAITDRVGVSLEESAALCSPYGNGVVQEALDVRDCGMIKEVVAKLIGEGGGFDILVNNAGINRPTKALEVDEANWEDHFATNVRGGFFCAQAVAPSMIERGYGRVIFISSQSGLIGIPGQPVYCATKGALINLVRTLGVEWAPFGITVNSVAPTFIETNLTRERLKRPEFKEFVLSKIPSRKLSIPDDVAYATLYLASEEAAMVNATTLSVDGGWTAW